MHRFGLAFFSLLIIILSSGCTGQTQLPINVSDNESTSQNLSGECLRYFNFPGLDLDRYAANKVIIEVSTKGIERYSILETPPAGWEIIETDGSILPTGQIKWANTSSESDFSEGYYLRNHYYVIKPPVSAEGTFDFYGECNYGPPDKVEQVGGYQKMYVGRGFS